MALTCDNALLGLRRMSTTEQGTMLVEDLILYLDRWTVLLAVRHGHRLTSTDVLQTLRLKQVRLHLRQFLMLHLKHRPLHRLSATRHSLYRHSLIPFFRSRR